jgi:hypothetical protein
MAKSPPDPSILLHPTSRFAVGEHRVYFCDGIWQMFLFIIVGAIEGSLKDREQWRSALNEKLEVLAALGESMASVPLA